MNRGILLYSYTTYSFFLNLAFLLLDLLPYPIRILIFRLVLAKVGDVPLIDYGVYFRYPKKIKIGNNVAINRGCELIAAHLAGGGSITIGNNVVLGPHVKIFTAGHDYATINLVDTAAPVVINDFVWVGGNATILPGVTIGEWAVIGAGSVVTRDIPSHAVAVGNPARVIKSRVLSKLP